MKFRLNRKSQERLKSLVRAGEFVDRAWNFSVADSNALLGDPANWTEYQQWFLGIDMTKPDSATGTGAIDQNPHKDWYAYPFGKGDVANLAALRAIAISAKFNGDNDIAEAAKEVLALAAEKIKDAVTSGATAPDITFTSNVHIKASAEAGKLPTFDADAYTGGAMQLEGYTHPLVIDLNGLEVNHSRPVLRDHDPKKPLGHTTNVVAKDGELKAQGIISGSGPHVDETIDAAKKGFPWQVSVGAKNLQNEFVPSGSTGQANGRTFAGPVNIARRSSLHEISILSLGADDNTAARIAAHAAGKASMKLKKKFAAWAKARNIVMADMEDDSMASAAKAMYKAQMKCEADDPADADDDGADDKKPDPKSAAVAPNIQAAATATQQAAPAITAASVVAEIRAGALAEQVRLNTVRTTLDQYRKDVPAEKFALIEAKAIGGEYNPERLELELIKARRPEISAPNINTGASGQADGAIIAAACARSFGVGEKASYAGLDERGANIAASYAGLTLHGIIAATASRAGLYVRAGGIDDNFLRDFLPADKKSHRDQMSQHERANPMIRASSSAGFSTVSLSGITENIMDKAMLEQYNMWPTIVPDICYERDTNDFKPFKVYRLTAAGGFQPLGPGGELKNFGLQDESYSNQVSTKGTLLVLKREDIINDDMGALMQSPQVLGRKAALNREKTVFTTFLSGLSTAAPGASINRTANAFNFFSTGAKNLLTGGGSALSIASLTNADTKFMQQVDANSDPIGVMPDRLLVCPELKAVANNLFQGANLTVNALDLPSASSGTSAAQTGKQTVNYNQHVGKYRPLVTPFLGGSSPVAGASATQWALLSSPAGGMATVQVGYLRGQRTPIIRQVETDAIMLGIAYQAIYDFGVALLDYRCGVYSAGA